MKKHIYDKTIRGKRGKNIRQLTKVAGELLVSLDNVGSDIDVGNETKKVYYGIKAERRELSHGVLKTFRPKCRTN